jgi:hypothetical protein
MCSAEGLTMPHVTPKPLFNKKNNKKLHTQIYTTFWAKTDLLLK